MPRPKPLIGCVVIAFGGFACADGNGPSEQDGGETFHPNSLVSIAPLGSRPFGAAVTLDGSAVVSRLDTAAVTVYDATTGALIGHVGVGTVPTSVAAGHSGGIAYVTNQFSGSVGVVDISVMEQVNTIPVAGDPFVVTLGGSFVYVSTNIGWVYRIDANTHGKLDSIQLAGAVNGLAADDGSVFATTVTSRQLYHLSVSLDVVRSMTLNGAPQQVRISTDGARVFVANERSGLDVIDLETWTPTTIPLTAGGFDVQISPDGRIVYVTMPRAGEVIALNQSDLRASFSLPFPGRTPRRMALSVDGRHGVVALEDGGVAFLRASM